MIRRILISLDALLDTRLGVISRINPEAAKLLVTKPEYWERVYDDWFKLTEGMVTNEQFRDAWIERGGENTYDTYIASFETGLAPLIYQMLASADVNMLSGMTKLEDEIGLAINVYPYDFSFAERNELAQIFRDKYGSELNVSIVSHSLEELDVGLLAGSYGAMILYDFAEWFKIHHIAIVNSLMSDFAVIHPKLFDRDPSELTVEQQKSDMFRFRLATQHNMDINYIDTSYFSLMEFRNVTQRELDPDKVSEAMRPDETSTTFFTGEE